MQRMQKDLAADHAAELEQRRDRAAARRILREEQSIIWRIFHPEERTDDEHQQELDEADWSFYAEESAEWVEFLRAAGQTENQIEQLFANPLPAKKRRELMATARVLPSMPEGEDGECPVCFVTMVGRQVIELACTHVVCAECLQRELRVRRLCPCCREPLRSRNDANEASSSNATEHHYKEVHLDHDDLTDG